MWWRQVGRQGRIFEYRSQEEGTQQASTLAEESPSPQTLKRHLSIPRISALPLKPGKPKGRANLTLSNWLTVYA